ncbi:ABC transporter ATP-binding protein [Ferrimonas lipolytica]|uniref:ATP-binding cassette domain-containing protein n=1 Tax=Ferrimonas lipolytica TaxID=2724191 RepID=A0A6H1UDL7_9GAMM|nr:ABC transporter transmembrane domain-containing protein [Ferrimonas lipolytica]QIZ76719.1 ATP-binding cassette domain-containing protein [Ferrimonas lipolytica]
MSATNPQGRQRSTFNLLFRYVFADKPLLYKSLFLLVLATMGDVAGPLIAKVYIDDYLLAGNLEATPLISLLLLYIVLQLSSAALRYMQAISFTKMALAAVQDIRKRVFDRVVRLPMSYFDHARTGQLVSRITNDTEAIKDLYVQFLSNVLGNVMLLIGILVAMAILNVKLMLIALGLIPAVLLIIYLYQKISGKVVAESRALRSDINANLAESIGGMTVLQATNQQQRFADKFSQLNQRYYIARLKTIKASGALLRPAISFLSVLTTVFLLYVFGEQVVTGVAEIGVLYAFLNYMGRFTEPLAEITQRFNLYQQAMTAGDRVSTLLNEQQQHYGEQQSSISSGSISIKELNFGYNNGDMVLKKINLDIADGSFYAIVGHTGSGKSTLLSLLLDFYPVAKDQLKLGNVDINDLSQQALRNGIGLIPQEPFILASTVFANIDMGRGLTQAQVEQAAIAADLHHTIIALTNGYQTELGEGGMRLSTGQRQQLVIARALASKPKILLLDEATANVDSETEQVVQQALNQLRGEITIIAVAHRLSTISHADNIVLLEQGMITEQGDHSQLMQREGGTYRAMYLLQQQAARVEQAELTA